MNKVFLVQIYCLLLTNIVFAQTTYFDQGFSAGGTISNYNSGGTNNFTGIATAMSAMGITVSIDNNSLVFERTSGTNGAYFAKIDGFSATPSTMVLQFTMNLISNTSQTGAATFFIGSGLVNDAGNIIANANVYSKLTVDFGALSGEFRFRDIASGSQSSYFSGSQAITWVLNNSLSPITYNIPGAGMSILDSDKWDLWVGSTKIFSDKDAIEPTQTLSQFKFTFNGATSASISKLVFDDFLIRNIAGILPVSLTSFNAYATDKQTVSVQWQTAQERNSSHFIVERSTDLQSFTTIAQLDAAGTTDVPRQYEFTDLSPLPSLNYYRLTQVDTDGATQRYRPVAVRLTPVCSVYPNPSDGSVWQLELNDAPTSTLMVQLSNLLGNSYSTRLQPLGLNRWRVEPQSQIPVGCYVMSIQTDEKTLHQKVWVH